MTFHLEAGKYDTDQERNVKYAECFENLEDALKALDQVKGYPWIELYLQNGNYMYSIEPIRCMVKEKGFSNRFVPCDQNGDIF